MQIRDPVSRHLLPVLALSTGCFYVDPINQRPSIDIAAQSGDAVFRAPASYTRMVAIGHVSNALGTINPVRQIVEMAHRAGALALIDGAQAAPAGPDRAVATLLLVFALKRFSSGELHQRTLWLGTMKAALLGGS